MLVGSHRWTLIKAGLQLQTAICCGLFAISFYPQWAILGFWGFFIYAQVLDLEKLSPFEDAKG